MARLARLVVPGEAHHLLQRGNNRQAIFLDDQDRQTYLNDLREATRLHGVRVHAYCLQPDHVHLLVTPLQADSLARAMQTLGRRYVGAFNRRHRRSGTLWEGRYRTTWVHGEGRVLDVMRYIEQHGARHGERIDFARTGWSSAAHHLGRVRDPLLSEHPVYWAQGNTPFEREDRHLAALQEPLAASTLAVLRQHVHSGWPWVDPQAEAARTLGGVRPLAPRAPGRKPSANPFGAVSVPK